MSRFSLDADTAARFARIALGHVRQEYPHKLDHVLGSDEDALPAHVLHPIFFGSFDWHSCVHGWWTLLTLRRLFPGTDEARAIAKLADLSFTAEKVGVELDYLQRPLSRGFERPYGWAWLLQLHLEASRHKRDAWAAELEPLARAFADRLRDYLDVLTYPIRVGTHFNTPFALVLSLEWAEQFDPPLAEAIRERAKHWFENDRDCQAWEPGGDEFLSPALIEALCMARCLTEPEFHGWFGGFLPNLDASQPATLVHPGDRQRPQRRQDRASRRAEPQPGLVLAKPGAAAAGRGVAASLRHRRGASRSGHSVCRRRLYGRALARELRAAGPAD